MQARFLPHRDPRRTDRILSVLGQTWKHCPEQRLGQLLVNAMTAHTGRISDTTRSSFDGAFEIEDEVIEAALKEFVGRQRWSDD